MPPRMLRARPIRALCLITACLLVTMACGDDDDPEASTDTTAAGVTTTASGSEPIVVRHAASSTADAYIPQYRAPELFGDKFGISTEDELQMFESHATASQVMVSGGADVGSGSVTQAIQLMEQDVDMKLFCPLQSDSTEHLVGITSKISDIQNITDPNIRVAIDSPGGLVNYIMNQIFFDLGMDLTVDDLENVSVLEDGSLRLSALASGDVDVGSVDLFEIADLQEQIGAEEVTVLSVAAEDSDFLANVLWAPTDWLAENAEVAGAFCATVLYSNRALASDIEQYKAALDKYTTTPVPEEIVQGNWDFARKYEVWPYNADSLNEELINNQIQVSVASGLLEESASDLTFADIVDPRPMEIAMELLGGPVTPEQVADGDI